MKETFQHISRTLRIPFNRYSAFRRLIELHSKERSLDELVGWSMRFPSKGYFKISTIQVRSEILALANAVASLKPKIILEIGTARGGTLLLWSNLATEKVISCDINDMDRMSPIYKKFPPIGSQCEVVPMSGDSHSEDFRRRVESELNGEQVDFLFIDGDHTEVGVEKDYNDYHHLVRPGGLIAFHDIVEKQAIPTNQVYFFWKRLKERVDTEEFINDPEQCGYGIGIVRVPE